MDQTSFSRFGPKNQFEVHRDAINRFLRGLGLNWKLFNNFDVWHSIGRSRIFVPKIECTVFDFNCLK